MQHKSADDPPCQVAVFSRKAIVVSLATVFRRIYADFLMSSRLPDYRAMLQQFVEHGYQFTSVDDFARRLVSDGLNPAQKLVILRQDVDTDVRTARLMWEIEQELGISTSRYFRLTTVDVRFMQDIDAAGGEASYHYEEASTFAKSHRISSPAELRRRFGDIQFIFEQNLRRLRDRTGLRMTTVAAHGDFINRKLGVVNHEILADQEFRRQVGVEFEVYDPALNALVDARFCDRPYPTSWSPREPQSVLAERDARIVYIMIHPRHWRADAVCNLRDDVGRVWDEVRYAA
jgi:hypothetical protein